MPPHMLLRIDEHRPHLELSRLERPEHSLDLRQALVGFHRFGGPQCGSVQAGPNDVNAVELRFGCDPVPFAGPAQIVVGHDDLEVLLHLLAVGLAAHAAIDPVLAAQLRVLAPDHGGDVLKGPLGRAQERLAFAGALLSQAGIQAHDQSLAGKLRAEDFGGLVGDQLVRAERGLRGARRGLDGHLRLLEQLADVDGLQRRGPAQSGGFEVFPDAGRGEHAAIAHEGDLADAEPLAGLAHLGPDGGRVRGVADE